MINNDKPKYEVEVSGSVILGADSDGHAEMVIQSMLEGKGFHVKQVTVTRREDLDGE